MARILGVDIPNKKRSEIALTYIYGIGRSSSRQILAKLRIDPDKFVSDWSESEYNLVRDEINTNFLVEGRLRAENMSSIKRLKDISCYRGLRHRMGLPVRGQKTKSNSRTRKGKGRTIANKKKASK